MICECCSRIFGAEQALQHGMKEITYIHHPTVQSLFDSASSGCFICFHVKKGFTAFNVLRADWETAKGFTYWKLLEYTLRKDVSDAYCLHIGLLRDLNPITCPPATLTGGYESWNRHADLMVILLVSKLPC
jgi:hypothetical protein